MKPIREWMNVVERMVNEDVVPFPRKASETGQSSRQQADPSYVGKKVKYLGNNPRRLPDPNHEYVVLKTARLIKSQPFDQYYIIGPSVDCPDTQQMAVSPSDIEIVDAATDLPAA